jgi:hypothetical protein
MDHETLSSNPVTAENLRACFAVLELPPNSSWENVKSAYRELVKVWHPDRFADSPSLQHRAQEKLKAISLAYAAIEEAFKSRSTWREPPPKPAARKPPESDGQWLVDTSLRNMRDGRTSEQQRRVYVAALEAYGSHEALAAEVLPLLIEAATIRVTGSATNRFKRYFKDVRIAQFGIREKSEYPTIIARWIMDNGALTSEYQKRRDAFVATAVNERDSK